MISGNTSENDSVHLWYTTRNRVQPLETRASAENLRKSRGGQLWTEIEPNRKSGRQRHTPVDVEDTSRLSLEGPTDGRGDVEHHPTASVEPLDALGSADVGERVEEATKKS